MDSGTKSTGGRPRQRLNPVKLGTMVAGDLLIEFDAWRERLGLSRNDAIERAMLVAMHPPEPVELPAPPVLVRDPALVALNDWAAHRGLTNLEALAQMTAGMTVEFPAVAKAAADDSPQLKAFDSWAASRGLSRNDALDKIKPILLATTFGDRPTISGNATNVSVVLGKLQEFDPRAPRPVSQRKTKPSAS